MIIMSVVDKHDDNNHDGDNVDKPQEDFCVTEDGVVKSFVAWNLSFSSQEALRKYISSFLIKSRQKRNCQYTYVDFVSEFLQPLLGHLMMSLDHVVGLLCVEGVRNRPGNKIQVI